MSFLGSRARDCSKVADCCHKLHKTKRKDGEFKEVKMRGKSAVVDSHCFFFLV